VPQETFPGHKKHLSSSSADYFYSRLSFLDQELISYIAIHLVVIIIIIIIIIIIMIMLV